MNYRIIGRYKIEIIKEKCIGASSCIAFAPNVIGIEDNIAFLKNDGTDSPEDILSAAQSCPTKAIIITDTVTNKQLFPKI